MSWRLGDVCGVGLSSADADPRDGLAVLVVRWRGDWCDRGSFWCLRKVWAERSAAVGWIPVLGSALADGSGSEVAWGV